MSAQPEWSDLQLFLEVARRGSFSGAAAQVGVHHTTVARRMEQLEHALTSRLFDRHARGIRLTIAGEELVAHARALEQAVVQASRAVAGRDHRLEGEVRLTAPPELLGVLLPCLVQFREQAPGVTVRLDSVSTLRDLGRGEADLALRAGGAPPDDAIAHRLGPIDWSVFVLPGAPRDRWVAYAPGYPPELVQRELVGDLEPALVVESVAEAALAVAAGLGPGVLPHFAASPGLQPLGPTLVHSNLWLLVHVDLRRVARVRALADHLRAELTVSQG